MTRSGRYLPLGDTGKRSSGVDGNGTALVLGLISNGPPGTVAGVDSTTAGS